MSFDDTERLVVAALTAPVVGHSIIYGMSDNSTTWWDNTAARHIGYRPRDNAEDYAATIAGKTAPPGPEAEFHGGPFCALEFTGDAKRID
jgi:uronate dehydrogenase